MHKTIVLISFKQAIRESDTIARVGGDEFVAVLVNLSDDRTECVPMLKRILSAASEPVYKNTRALKVSASLGVAFFPQDNDTSVDQMLQQADKAMYQAKSSGRNQYCFFEISSSLI